MKTGGGQRKMRRWKRNRLWNSFCLSSLLSKAERNNYIEHNIYIRTVVLVVASFQGQDKGGDKLVQYNPVITNRGRPVFSLDLPTEATEDGVNGVVALTHA